MLVCNLKVWLLNVRGSLQSIEFQSSKEQLSKTSKTNQKSIRVWEYEFFMFDSISSTDRTPLISNWLCACKSAVMGTEIAAMNQKSESDLLNISVDQRAASWHEVQTRLTPNYSKLLNRKPARSRIVVNLGPRVWLEGRNFGSHKPIMRCSLWKVLLFHETVY